MLVGNLGQTGFSFNSDLTGNITITKSADIELPRTDGAVNPQSIDVPAKDIVRFVLYRLIVMLLTESTQELKDEGILPSDSRIEGLINNVGTMQTLMNLYNRFDAQ